MNQSWKTETSDFHHLSARAEIIDFKKPRSMVTQIYKALAEGISKGVLKPGQPLKESELQMWFKTSRAPIREAIRLLEAEGMIIVDHYKKKYVRPITHQILKETLPVMACLEGLAANLAAMQISDGQIDTLRKFNEEMQRNFEQKRYDLCSSLNFDFHRTYVKLANNETLIKAIRSILKNTIWLWVATIYFKKSELIPLSIVEHERIIEAFKTRNSTKAEEEVRKHIINLLEHALEIPGFYSVWEMPVPNQK